MDLKITQQKDNALFDRKDVQFVLAHDKATTPARSEVRKLIAAEIGTKTENVVVDRMDSEAGRASTHGVARAYKSAEAARKAEPEHLLKRNQLWVEPAKKEKPAEGAKEAPKADAKARPAPKKGGA